MFNMPDPLGPTQCVTCGLFFLPDGLGMVTCCSCDGQEELPLCDGCGQDIPKDYVPKLGDYCPECDCYSDEEEEAA